MGPIIVSTERLHLREWTAPDAHAFDILGQDPLVLRFITGGRPLTEREIQEFIGRQIEAQQVRGWCRWALELRAPSGDEPTGLVGFCGPGCTFAPDVELGWWLASALWNRGLATEAARAAADYCFGVVGFERLISAIAPFNHASRRVAEKIGFTLDGEFEHHGERTLRYALANPAPPAAPDPRFRRDCEGAPTTSVLSSEHGDEDEPAIEP